jgi:hypothetical protein
MVDKNHMVLADGSSVNRLLIVKEHFPGDGATLLADRC